MRSQFFKCIKKAFVAYRRPERNKRDRNTLTLRVDYGIMLPNMRRHISAKTVMLFQKQEIISVCLISNHLII